MVSLHLKGSRAIEEVFGVSRRTVRSWIAQGAPIRIVGRKYQASYPELWQWVSGESGRGPASGDHGPAGSLGDGEAPGAENSWYVVFPSMGRCVG